MDIHTTIAFVENIFQSWWVLIAILASFIEMSPVGWAIPGGVIVSISAFFSFGNAYQLVGILCLSTLGGVMSFCLAYYLGQKTGPSFVKKLRQEKAAELARKTLQKNGPVILTTSMIAGMTRFWVAYVAGSQNYNFLQFLKYATISSFSWSSIMAAIGFIAGSERERLENALALMGVLSWALIIIAVSVIIVSIKKEKSIEK